MGNTPAVVVVGGAVAYRSGQNWVVRQGFHRYLMELADLLGPIVFFAGISHDEAPGFHLACTLDDELVTVEPLAFATGTNRAQRLWRTAGDARRLRQAVEAAHRVIHYFPAAGGPLGTLGLRSASAHLTYFKSDWLTHTRRRTGMDRLQLPYWWASELLEARTANAMVFRSQAHMQRLRRWSTGVTELAQPILATVPSDTPPTSSRANAQMLTLLFVGGLYKRKGLLTLVAAVKRLVEMADVPSFRVVLVGGQSLAEKSGEVVPGWLREAVEVNGVEELMEFVGYVDNADELAKHYSEADVFVLPAYFEGFPRVIDEAMSFGLPVVATSLDGIAAVLESGRDALLVPPRSETELANALATLLQSDQRRNELASASLCSYRRRVKESAAQQHARLLG